MSRGPQVHPAIQAAVAKFAGDPEWPAHRIHPEVVQIAQKFGVRPPSRRWIEKEVAKKKPPKSDQPWRLLDATPEEAATVPDILSAAITLSGVSAITPEHASLLVKIRRAVPNMPPTVVWRFSLEYLAIKDKDAAQLDAALALARLVGKPQHQAAVAQHVALHTRHWIGRPLIVWAGSKEAAQDYIDQIGRHGSLSRPGVDSWFEKQDYFGWLFIEKSKSKKEESDG